MLALQISRTSWFIWADKHLFHVKLELETVTFCPICQEKAFEPVFKCTDELVSKEQFSIIRCAACDLHLTSPRPTLNTIGQYYKSYEYISHSDSKGGLINWAYHYVRTIALKQKLSHIKQHTNGTRLLDNGAGSGGFLSYMANNGFDCVGLEPDLDARSLAHSKHGLFLKEPKVLDEMLGREKFDVITMWHVLEHIHEPVDLLKKLCSLLEKNGVLFVAVPNHRSKDALIYKNNWAAYDVPRHLFHFSKDTLSKAADVSGFVVDQIIPMQFDSYYVSMLSEKNRGVHLFNGILNGLRSNLAARFGSGEYSSQIYILRPLGSNKAT